MGERSVLAYPPRSPGFAKVIPSPLLVTRWKLWSLPGRVLLLVLAVHTAALVSTLSTAWAFPLDHAHWVVAAILMLAGVLHLEMTRSIERLRAKEAGAGPYYDLKTVWNVAALLLLPPLMATLVIVSTHTYGYLRIHRDDHNPHRWAYSCATVVVASQLAALVLAAGVGAYPGFPSSAVDDWMVVLAATFVRWMVNYLLVIVVSGLMRPKMKFKDAFVQLGEQVSEAAATGLAIAAAMMIAFEYYPLLISVYLVIGVLQQTSFYHHWKRERPFDPQTAVYSRTSFIEQAQAILDRARFRGDQVGCLLLDLDHFKRVNDTYGHNVGDEALVHLADAIKHEIRDDKDVPARWGGEEFVVLVPEVSHDVLVDVAERIRHRVSVTKVAYTTRDPVTGESHAGGVEMTVSIGAAMFPVPGGTARDEGLLDLIERADKLMYEAKKRGRNRVCSVRREEPGADRERVDQPATRISVSADTADVQCWRSTRSSG
jgi:diguanylate cyclase (GGDEF)-like protein